MPPPAPAAPPPAAPPGPAPAADPRTAEILDRVKAAFAAKGFDGASMQDLARAAGMSAGNFYRYFPSKDAIIAAMIARDLAVVEAEFAAIRAAPAPRPALMRAITAHVHQAATAGDGPLWAEIQAAAARRPEIAAIMGRMEEAARAGLLRSFALLARIPEAEAARRFADHATLVIRLVMAAGSPFCTASGRTVPPGEGFVALLLRSIERLLDEVEGSAPSAPPPGAPGSPA